MNHRFILVSVAVCRANTGRGAPEGQPITLEPAQQSRLQVLVRRALWLRRSQGFEGRIAGHMWPQCLVIRAH